MLIALDRNEVPLGQLVTAKNAEVRERLSGESLLSFELPNVREQVALLMLDGYIRCDGQLFVIKTIEEQTSGRNYVGVQAVHVYTELVDEYIDREVDLLGATAAQALTQALQGTPFTVGTVNVTGLKDIDISERSALKAVQEIRELWDCDLWFESRIVHLGTKGQNKGQEIRYGSNLKALRKPATTTNVITRLYVYGRDGLTIEAVNAGKKYLDSPNFGLYRRPKCADVRFNDITDPAELMAEGMRYLLARDKINVSYSVDYADLGDEAIELGDTVTITHMPFELQTMGTRVVERSYDPLQQRIRSIVLSSYLETSVDDMVALRKKQYYLERNSIGRNEAKDSADSIARSIAEAEAALAAEQAKAYADGIVSDEEQARIQQAAANLNTAKQDATEKMNAAKADAAAAASAASAAQTTANTAKTNADTANALLSDYSNDNKLTPPEKQATKLEWDGIVVERPTIEAQATVYGITTEKTAYTTAYTALNTYINPLLANLTVTSDITGSTFRSTFSTYYDKKTLLLKAIADKAKQLSDLAETNAKSYADVTYGETKTKVINGTLYVVDKYGQVIAGENGLDLNNIAGYGVESGGVIRVENVVPATYTQATITATRSDIKAVQTLNIGDTSNLPASNSSSSTFFVYYQGNATIETWAGPVVYNQTVLAYVTWTGKTANTLTGVTIKTVDSLLSSTLLNVNAGQVLFRIDTQTTADIVVSSAVVIMPNKQRFVIQETRFSARNVHVPGTDADGWKFIYLWVNTSGVIQNAEAGTSGGWKVYPPNPPAGCVRLGYLLAGFGTEDPDGTLNSTFNFSGGLPVYTQRIYHDTRYRDERAVRAEGGEALLGGVPYGVQTITVNTAPGEFKTFYLQVGKGKRSVNASLTLDDGSGYDNYSYGAQMVVGRKAANNADGLGRPVWANYTDADGQRGHVTGQRNLSPYGIHILNPRVWGKSYTLLYDADLMPDPSNAAVIALKLTFRNFGGSSESFDLKVNWHAL